jgi:predicted branched-subunit amino acid permease
MIDGPESSGRARRALRTASWLWLSCRYPEQRMPVTDPERTPPVERALSASAAREIRANALGIGLATGAYGISFGAIAVASGMTPWQAQALSLGMFTGASQFALVGVLGAGGGAVAAVITAWLLGARNGLYGLHMAPILRPRAWRRLVAAQWTIDESTGMGMAHQDVPGGGRLGFWATGAAVYVLWNLGTLLGAVGASALDDPARYGLDAAIPAGFMALLWPRLKDRTGWAVALGAAVIALALTPVSRPGIPVLASGAAAIAAGILMTRRPR